MQFTTSYLIVSTKKVTKGNKSFDFDNLLIPFDTFVVKDFFHNSSLKKLNLFLYIQVTNKPEEVKFSNAFLPILKEQETTFTTFDLDNHSDSLVISYAKRLLTESNHTLLFIETMPESKFSNLLSLLTYILDNPEGIEIVVKGENKKLEKMMSILTQMQVQENTHEVQTVREILSKFS
jgi:hypothetical protein